MTSKSTSPTQLDAAPRPLKINHIVSIRQRVLPPHTSTLGHPGTRIASRWRPESNGRHNSPLFSSHLKQPLSIDSSMTNEASTVIAKDQEENTSTTAGDFTKYDLARSSPFSLDLKVNAGLSAVQPPRTPQGRSAYRTFDDRGLSAAQRVRIELSSHSGSRSHSGVRANSFEDIFANNSPVDDEKKNGPRSCPTRFWEAGGGQAKFSPGRRRHERRGEFIASKLLPTRYRINSMLTYMQELKVSEASLQKQLVTSKRHTEEELNRLMSKLDGLRRMMQKLERERQEAQAKLEEKEKCIWELATKLKKAEATHNKRSTPARICSTLHDRLSTIAEEECVHNENDPAIEKERQLQEEKKPESLLINTSARTVEVLSTSQTAAAFLPLTRPQLHEDESTTYTVTSPRSPNRPLWDPWASGGAPPMENFPPVFTIGEPKVYVETTTVSTLLGQSKAMKAEEDELRSVLMSPRCASSEGAALHIDVQGNSSVVLSEQISSTPADSQLAPASNAGSLNLPFDLFRSMKAQCDNDEQITKEKSLAADHSSSSDPRLRVGTLPSTFDRPYEQRKGQSAVCGGSIYKKERQKTQLDIQTSKITLPEGGLDIPPSTNLAGQFAIASQLQAMGGNIAVKVERPYREIAPRTEDLKATQMSKFNSDPSIRSSVAHVQTALPFQQDSKIFYAEPASLETILSDFFTEVDKKRLKMAKVYGKRYLGHEEWLFGELTKRYGAIKVAALKARYEARDSNSTSSNGGGSGKKVSFSSKLSSGADCPTMECQSQPRHMQYFNSPSLCSNVNNCDADYASNVQLRREVEEVKTPFGPDLEEVEDRECMVPPPSLNSNNVSPPAGQSPSYLTFNDLRDSNRTAGVGPDDSVMIEGSTSPKFDEPTCARFCQSKMQASNPAPSVPRKRINESRGNAKDQKNEPPTVTLGSLLKELYTRHQTDKLINASVVAKQYLGKERELMGQRNRACVGGKVASEKRSRFVRTILLMLWLLVLLNISFFIAFVSLATIDAWECRASANDQHEFKSAEECVHFKKEVEAFTYKRVADYMSQSHPGACFCSKWNAHQSALLKNFSGSDFVDLVKLVPFSPDSFGRPWIASVKKCFFSNKFYNSYAKPVIDFPLAIGSFMWSHVLELTGIDKKFINTYRHEGDVKDGHVGNPPLGKESEIDVFTLKQDAESVDTKSEEETGEQLVYEAGALKVSVTLNENSVREGSNMDDDIRTDKPGIALKNKVLEENIPVDKRLAAIEIVSVASPSNADEDRNTGTSDDGYELDKIITEKSETANINKVELIDIESDATKNMIMHDAINVLDKKKCVDGDGVEAISLFVKRQACNFLIAPNEVAELALIDAANLSLEDNVGELNDVVESKVCRKSIGLPRFEVDSDAFTSLVEHLEPSSVDGEDVSRQERSDSFVELESVTSDLAMKRSDLIVHATEKATSMAGSVADMKIEGVSEFDVEASYYSRDVDVTEPLSTKSNIGSIGKGQFASNINLSKDAFKAIKARRIVDINSDVISEDVAEQVRTQGEHPFAVVASVDAETGRLYEKAHGFDKVHKPMTLADNVKSSKEIIFNELFVTPAEKISEVGGQSFEDHNADVSSTIIAETPSTVAYIEPDFDLETVADSKVEAIFLMHGDFNEENDEDEEITFMEELENPDELLRMAEQAAVATITSQR